MSRSPGGRGPSPRSPKGAALLLGLLALVGCSSPPPPASPRPITYTLAVDGAGYPPGSDQLELVVHIVRDSEAPWDSVVVKKARVVERDLPGSGIDMDLYNRCFIEGLDGTRDPFPPRFSLILRDRSSLHAFQHPVLVLQLEISTVADRHHPASGSDRVHRLPFDQP